ncbi:DNA-binding transcriptional regulator, GntR family [Pilibacter termitis]|uniref:DNA-binding transcriptional regulator, GntR family n=1 Tax=Pilibacter termitis TaxID=263852 RepID=A0A1T4KD20_9ENTE|nr:GntR family transcriptional regulator [Pilibacter termitis]SJZ40235.1 DNA-binding transcriptional regulator, GntR family [Pilibacter termitis]
MKHSNEQSAYITIKQSILYGSFSPDELYSEATLSKKLNMSRTPVRSALKILEKEGLISYRKNRGFLLRNASNHELLELTQISVLWMKEALQLAKKGERKFQSKEIQEQLDLAKEYRCKNEYARYINQMTKVYLKIMEMLENQLLLATYEDLWARQITSSLYRKVTNVENADKEKTKSTILFFQKLIDEASKGNYDTATQALDEYFEYAKSQILRYEQL